MSRESHRLKTLRVLPRAGERARGWLVAGPLRIPCALGPAGIVRDKREGDGATPAGRFPLLWGYYRPDRRRPAAGGVALQPMRRDGASDPPLPHRGRGLGRGQVRASPSSGRASRAHLFPQAGEARRCPRVVTRASLCYEPA